MAIFNKKSFITYDDYMTPKHVWADIKKYIPNNMIIWEAFFGDGESGNHLKELGFDVIHERIDFFEDDRGDIVISNPPFSKIPQILTRLKDIDKL